ncbi:hypothetical protein BHM03_00017838 [Ensete ventricosum]|nr:hypothetical protein BHM03_00017838 [Ensete ventricosum]
MDEEEKATMTLISASPSVGGAALKSAEEAKVRIAGAWSGFIEVELEAWTLPILRQEVARRAGAEPDCVNLICGGKVLRDDSRAKPLGQLGLKNNAKVLATVVRGDRGKAINDQAASEAEHAKKLARIRSEFNSLDLAIFYFSLIPFLFPVPSAAFCKDEVLLLVCYSVGYALAK